MISCALVRWWRCHNHPYKPIAPEPQVVELSEPMGWVSIPLFAIDEKTGDQAMLRAHFLQICVVSMHQVRPPRAVDCPHLPSPSQLPPTHERPIATSLPQPQPEWTGHSHQAVQDLRPAPSGRRLLYRRFLSVFDAQMTPRPRDRAQRAVAGVSSVSWVPLKFRGCLGQGCEAGFKRSYCFTKSLNFIEGGRVTCPRARL